ALADCNRWALLAALREAGGEVDLLGIAPDRPDPLRELVLGAVERCDVLVTSGGVSVGTHDLVKPLLESLGEVHVGRVKLRPGKPFTFATLPDRKLAFGLPGFPVSSLVTLEVFVRPALRKLQGHSRLHRPELPVRLGYDAESDRVRFPATPIALIRTQAAATGTRRLLGLGTAWPEMEARLVEVLAQLRAEGCTGVVLGDIHLADVRAWYEDRVIAAGL